MDIYSGRVRYTRLLFWIPVRETIEDSALTKALLPEDLAGRAPEWRHAVTLSPGVRNSPHYAFHSAIIQIQEVNALWRIGEFTPEARQESAKRILQLWQQSGGDSGAKDYLRALGELAFSANGKTNGITEADLPRL